MGVQSTAVAFLRRLSSARLRRNPCVDSCEFIADRPPEADPSRSLAMGSPLLKGCPRYAIHLLDVSLRSKALCLFSGGAMGLTGVFWFHHFLSIWLIASRINEVV